MLRIAFEDRALLALAVTGYRLKSFVQIAHNTRRAS